MDMEHSEHGHSIEVCRDVQVEEKTAGAGQICGGARCGFSDAKSSTQDAEERLHYMRRLLLAAALCIIFMTVEIVGGIKANSLAILMDAARLLSDVAAFAISLFSLWASGWEATSRQSYGFFQIEILGALVSLQMIWVLAGILVYEAIVRLIYDTGEVQGFLMFLVSAFGLVVNIIMALLLGHDLGHGHTHSHGHDHTHGDKKHNHENIDDMCTRGVSKKSNQVGHSGHGDDHHHAHETNHIVSLLSPSESNGGAKQKRRNINVQGAYLHVLGDSIQSIGVLIGGAIIWYKPEWKIIDLICTLIFSVIVLGTTINMLCKIWEVLMESTPREIDTTKLEEGLHDIDEVVAIHELHIWAITVGKALLSCHVKIRLEADAYIVLDKVVEYIRGEHNISHVTIQIEREPQP